MIIFQTKLKQYLISTLLLTVFSTCTASVVPASASEGCHDPQCSKFISWGFSMDIASQADNIYKLMALTNINTGLHTGKSFMDAVYSNWGPHHSGNKYSAFSEEILSIVEKLGMYIPHNEISSYIPNNQKLYIIILGSSPTQLCSILRVLNEMKKLRVTQTFLIGSTTPVYESYDYLKCPFLNDSQREELEQLANTETQRILSDKKVMSIYFNSQNLNAIFPLTGGSQIDEAEASFHSNRLMQSFLKSNTLITRTRSSVIIAAPQPYMPEAMSILKAHMKSATIYRLSSASPFSIYESLNALRNWLKTDRRLK